jgi:hypothetical protein
VKGKDDIVVVCCIYYIGIYPVEVRVRPGLVVTAQQHAVHFRHTLFAFLEVVHSSSMYARAAHVDLGPLDHPCMDASTSCGGRKRGPDLFKIKSYWSVWGN